MNKWVYPMCAGCPDVDTEECQSCWAYFGEPELDEENE